MKTVEELEQIGGHPSVDFVNTLHNWTEFEPADYLRDFDDFVRWNRMVGLIEDTAKVDTNVSVEDSERALEGVRRLRKSMHDLFAAKAERLALPDRALDHLTDVIRQTVQWRRLVLSEDGAGVRGEWALDGAPVDAFPGPVAWACADLLEHGPLDRLKICPADDCGWLFLDLSKNRSRHWCSMANCGNAAKVRRFRQRKAAH